MQNLTKNLKALYSLQQNAQDVLFDEAYQHIEEMNSVKSGRVFKPILRATEIKMNQEYEAEIIKKIKSKFGASYVIESDTFSFFLPNRYNQLEIPEKIAKRYFMITGLEALKNGRKSAKIVFSLKK